MILRRIVKRETYRRERSHLFFPLPKTTVRLTLDCGHTFIRERSLVSEKQKSAQCKQCDLEMDRVLAILQDERARDEARDALGMSVEAKWKLYYDHFSIQADIPFTCPLCGVPIPAGELHECSNPKPQDEPRGRYRTENVGEA